MVYIWDYFMRRKGLLLAVMAVFAMGYMLSYQVLTSNAEAPETSYIEIENWGESVGEIEVPQTGGEVKILAVMEAKEVVKLPESVEESRSSNEVEVSDETEAPTEVSENNLEGELGNFGDETATGTGVDEMSDIDAVSEVPKLAEVKPEEEAPALEIAEPEIEENDMNVILLVLGGAVVLTLGGYFIYQHFMR